MSEILIALNGAFYSGWQGPALLGSLRGITPAEALIIPPRLKHSIWNQVLHAAYWKYAVCLRIAKAGVTVRDVPTDNGELAFPRSPSNWATPPRNGGPKEWRADIALLKQFHEAVADAASRLTNKQLDSIPPGGKSRTLRPMLLGLAAHDAYHCGQIQLIKRLIRRR